MQNISPDWLSLFDLLIDVAIKDKSTEYKAALVRARKIIETVPSEKQSMLAAAHDRYMCFCGVYTSDPEDDHVAEDRAAFPHLLASVDGIPSLGEACCADFMMAISGLPREWCLAWGEMAFAARHGDDFWDKKLKRPESVRLEAGTAA